MWYAFWVCVIGFLMLGTATAAMADMESYLDMFSLEQSTERIAIRFDPMMTVDWNDIYAQYQFISTDPPPRPIIDEFYILELTNAITADSAIDIVMHDERFAFANPVLMDEYGHHIYITTRLYLEIRTEHFVEVESLAEQYGTSVIDTLFASRNGVVIEMPSGKSYNPLTLGHQLMNDSTVVMAIPDFVLPFKSFFEPNDQYYSNQYDLVNFDMPLAWEVTIPPPH